MNWEPVLVAAITALPPTIMAYASYRQATKAKQQSVVNHEAINGKMDKYIEAVGAAEKAKGKLEEKDEQHERDAERGKNDRRGK